MPASRLVPAALLLSWPVVASAADPPQQYEDHHERPEYYNNPDLVLEPRLPPQPSHVEYPLAVQFIPADPSNYTSNGIESFDYVVVHTMEGYYNGTISWFQNPDANVSTHYVMRAEDGEVTQMLHNADKGWHVGGSNPYALGIEHEGFIAEPEWYTWETYQSSALLTRWLCDTYEIPLDRDHVVGHVELPNQTHTDPGPHWDWDRYMALIREVVSEGHIEGVVVQRSRACTVTTDSDTWVKSTFQQSDELGDGDKCFIPAGTELTYYHAGPERVSHRRLVMEPGGPCRGLGTLDEEGWIYTPVFSGFCDPGDMAPDGPTTVILDEGESEPVDTEGSFVFTDVEPGEHTLDVEIGSENMSWEPVQLDEYPGIRVVLVVDSPGGGDDPPPDDDGDTGATGDDGGDSGDGEDGGDDGSTDTGTDGGDDDWGGTSSDDPSGTSGTGASSGTDSGGAGLDDDEGCGCATASPRMGGPMSLLWILLVSVRRRQRTNS